MWIRQVLKLQPIIEQGFGWGSPWGSGNRKSAKSMRDAHSGHITIQQYMFSSPATQSLLPVCAKPFLFMCFCWPCFIQSHASFLICVLLMRLETKSGDQAVRFVVSKPASVISHIVNSLLQNNRSRYLNRPMISRFKIPVFTLWSS